MSSTHHDEAVAEAHASSNAEFRAKCIDYLFGLDGLANMLRDNGERDTEATKSARVRLDEEFDWILKHAAGRHALIKEAVAEFGRLVDAAVARGTDAPVASETR